MAEPAIYVDADACPVKDETVRVAVRHKLMVLFVANQGARPSRDPMIRYITVPPGPDAADDWIIANLMPNDIVVTADILLAERALEARCACARVEWAPLHRRPPSAWQ